MSIKEKLFNNLVNHGNHFMSFMEKLVTLEKLHFLQKLVIWSGFMQFDISFIFQKFTGLHSRSPACYIWLEQGHFISDKEWEPFKSLF